MLVLGITDGITCGAALVRDGRVLAAVNEEALSRLKMAYGFPRQSISEVLDIAGIAANEIDLVLSATRNNYFFDGIRAFDGWLQSDKGVVRNTVFNAVGSLSGWVDRVPGLEQAYYRARWPIFAARRRNIQKIIRQESGLKCPIEFIDHHLAHATSAYFTSGFDDALVVSMDGGGDGASSHIYDVRNGSFKRLDYTNAFNSLANYYAYVTHICGYKAQKHEGKITGLAAHGEPKFVDLLSNMITFQNGQIRNISGRVFFGAIRAIQNRLPSGWKKEDLAASIQQHCETIAVKYISQHLNQDVPRDVALAGGLFANVRINQKIYEIEGVTRLFVHPGMTDAGLAVGAALGPCMVNRSGATMSSNAKVIRNVYLGREFSESQIESVLQASGLEYNQCENVETVIASLLAKGHVVARYNGRMEYGPRALGNRSILYQPGDVSVNDWLNVRLKRTEFMPFAPAVLSEFVDDCFENTGNAFETARFMTITFDCNNWMKQNCPGVVHVDGTARPQIVKQDDNPSFYMIIDEFRKLTGIPMIINTSFNMHEEPIVYTPADAIRAFSIGHLDYLAIGNFLVPAPQPVDRILVPVTGAGRKTVS